MDELTPNRQQIKDKLLQQYKGFRNYSMKIAVLLGAVTFGGRFLFLVITRDQATLTLEDAFLQSALTAIGFALFGFCVGSIVGAILQRKHFKKLEAIKRERYRILNEQISIRQSKLEALEINSVENSIF